MLRTFLRRTVKGGKFNPLGCRGLSSFSVEKKKDHFVLKLENETKETAVTFKWLRDHCR
jgi:hypothetical protein